MVSRFHVDDEVHNLMSILRVFRPGIYPKNMKLDSKTATFYESRPSEWLGGRKAIVPCANILGGGSSINFMVSLSPLVRCTIG